ncbi:LysR family transcriptional regulator [Variovorax guangxiensis]|uniref:LysR family transcriptional regulator n=1 Tax=Variovorax guangxiensis TaxID=1775474 RepID=UPI00285C8099|nr:DNA-binding transcriptional LysR family regulator [Variovorax guangxiensis]
MIDNLAELAIFDKVASAGSLTGAANELGLSLAVVSKRLATLEARMGVRLLNRTTRRQSMTQEGERFHLHCVRILAEVQQAEAVMQHSRTDITGQLRVTAPRMLGTRYLAALAVQFQTMHPALRIELVLSDDVVDLVEQGVDLALRFGVLDDSTMTARRIADSELILCAAPDYLRRFGAPDTPGALAGHNCILYGTRSARHWLFQHEGRPVSAEVNATFLCNDGNAAKALALAGGGILLKSVWDVGAELSDGTLVRVLERYSMPSAPLHVVYPHALHLAPRVRRFADYALDSLRREWERLTPRPVAWDRRAD